MDKEYALGENGFLIETLRGLKREGAGAHDLMNQLRGFDSALSLCTMTHQHGDRLRDRSRGELTVAGLQQLLADRYLATDRQRGTAATFLWFVEEIGELATALANNTPPKTPTAEERANLEEEFADVIAWLCTLANINDVDLQRALEKYTVKMPEGEK
jgi:NTP pyrophosphatase (non-canonical NTP hydrolase)